MTTVARDLEDDPILLAVINNRLAETVTTMERLLFHSGYSTILRESYDGSAGITDVNDGAVLSSGMATHLPPYYYSVQAILKRYAIADMREGDSFIVNDPYLAGNLPLPDVVIVSPAFHRGQHLGFCVSIAHEPDLGGIVPGRRAFAREITTTDCFPACAVVERRRNPSRGDRQAQPDAVLAGDLRARQLHPHRRQAPCQAVR